MVGASYYVIFGSKDVKFLQNFPNLEANVIHTCKRDKDLFVLLASSYSSKLSANYGASIWHARLGHLRMDKLKAIVSKNLVNELSNLSYFGCVMYVKAVNMEMHIVFHLTSLFLGVKFQ